MIKILSIITIFAVFYTALSLAMPKIEYKECLQWQNMLLEGRNDFIISTIMQDQCNNYDIKLN